MSSRRLRSSVLPEEKELKLKRRKEEELEKLNRPFIKYNGKINYATTLIDCACACDDLLTNNLFTPDEEPQAVIPYASLLWTHALMYCSTTCLFTCLLSVSSRVTETCCRQTASQLVYRNLANNCLEAMMVVGFDMEWPFSFKTGPGKTALIQISPSVNVCHLLHVSELQYLPKGLIEFLQHPKVRMTGVNIKNDIRKLCRDFSGFDVDKLLANCVDSGVMANKILPVTQRWSMEKLVDFVLKMKINKDKKVRMSKWHILPLEKNQQVYAAIDGFVSLLLYQELKKLEMDIIKEQDKNLLNTNVL